MTLHQQIVVCQLVRDNLNEMINKRSIIQNVKLNIVKTKVSELKLILHSDNTDLEDYHQSYIQWNEAVEDYETFCNKTNSISLTRNQLQFYINQLADDYGAMQ